MKMKMQMNYEEEQEEEKKKEKKKTKKEQKQKKWGTPCHSEKKRAHILARSFVSYDYFSDVAWSCANKVFRST